MLLFLYETDSGCIRLYQHYSALFQVYQVVSGFICKTYQSLSKLKVFSDLFSTRCLDLVPDVWI
jgi:hypothetical protein